MKKKLLALFAVVLVAALLIGGYYAFLAPKAQAGDKRVTVEVVVPGQNITRSFSYSTDQTYVEGLLREHQDELQLEVEETSFGPFITGLLGVQADAAKEFFCIQVEGADTSVGIALLPVEDGKTYSFTLMGF